MARLQDQSAHPPATLSNQAGYSDLGGWGRGQAHASAGTLDCCSRFQRGTMHWSLYSITRRPGDRSDLRGYPRRQQFDGCHCRCRTRHGERPEPACRAQARQGRGSARRAGFDVAAGQIVFSADADTIYPARWLRSLLDPLANGEVVAATSTARIDDLSGWRNSVFNITQPVAMWCYRLALGHHCLSGFSFAIRREVYRASGGFDPELNAEEDADLSRRVARLGASASAAGAGMRGQPGVEKGRPTHPAA